VRSRSARTILSGEATRGQGFNATMNDYVEYDDRGYIYAADRAAPPARGMHRYRGPA